MSTIPQIDAASEIGKAYEAMVQLYGKEIFREKRRALGCLLDMAPKLPHEAKLLEAALDAGVPDLLQSGTNDKKTAKENGKKAIAALKAKGLGEEEAIELTENLAAALGMKVSLRPDYSSGGQIPYETKPGSGFSDAVSRLDHIRWFLNHQEEYSWNGGKDALKDLRKLFANAGKNRQEIITKYKDLTRKFQNNPYEYGLILEKSDKTPLFTADALALYFVVPGDMPVPVGFVSEYSGMSADEILRSWEKKKNVILDQANKMKNRFSAAPSANASAAADMIKKGRRFVLFSLIFIGYCIYSLKDYVVNVDFRPFFQWLMQNKQESWEMFRQYPYGEGRTYLQESAVFTVAAIVMLLLLFSILGTIRRIQKCKKSTGTPKKSEKALRILEKEVPEKINGLEKSFRDYLVSKKGKGSISVTNYSGVLTESSKPSDTGTVKKTVSLPGKFLRLAALLFCILFTSYQGSTYRQQNMIMGSYELANQNAVTEKNTSFGTGTVIQDFTLEEDFEVDLSQVPEVGITMTSQTSFLGSSSGQDYSANAAVDHNPATSWQEGVAGNGEGESITLTFDRAYLVQYMTFKLGNWRSETSYAENGRPYALVVRMGGMETLCYFSDIQKEYVMKVSPAIYADSVEIMIFETYRGTSTSDTCISEVGIYGMNNDQVAFPIGGSSISVDESVISEELVSEEVYSEEMIPQAGVVSWDGMVTRDQQSALLTGGTRLVQDQMAQYLNANAAKRAVYVLDVTDGQEYGVENSDEGVPASALIAIPIMYTIACDAQNGIHDVGEMVTYRVTFAGGRGSTQKQDGMPYTMIDLLQDVMKYSDNNAMNSLIDYLGLDHINQVCHDYGYYSVDLQRKLMAESSSLENYISAKDAALMVNAIYQNNFSRIDRSFLENYFYIDPSDKVNRGMYPVGKNYSVFLNFNGITDKNYNEIGLFSTGERTFIITILTSQGNSENSVSMVNSLTSYIAPLMT